MSGSKLETGKITDILKWLLTSTTEDSGTYEVFTLTYRDHDISAEELLKKIERRFRKTKDKEKLQTVANCIVKMLIAWANTSFSRDFVIKQKVPITESNDDLLKRHEERSNSLPMVLAQGSFATNSPRFNIQTTTSSPFFTSMPSLPVQSSTTSNSNTSGGVPTSDSGASDLDDGGSSSSSSSSAKKKNRRKKRKDGESTSESDYQGRSPFFVDPVASPDEEQDDPSEDNSANEDIRFASIVTADMYEALLSFLEQMANRDCAMQANRVKLALLRVRPKVLALAAERERPKKRHRSSKRKDIKIQDLEIHAIAEQLTAFESRLFCTIKAQEFLGLGWQKDDKMTRSPHIVKMYGRFNEVSFWVASHICSCEDIKDRSAVLSSFISLAVELRAMNNYNALMEVLGGLNNVAVQRMKKTWAVVMEKQEQTWNELNDLMDSVNNYRSYREALSQSTLPAVPFLGVYLRDLTFIEENPDFIKKKINFDKMRMIGGILTEVRQFQQKRFVESQKSVDSKSFIQQVTAVPEESDDILYASSLRVEPKDEAPVPPPLPTPRA
eukprot:TRINITY_DN311_c2_g4_i1.p1 TRINITY_DN311_c2_g4~~TRINITY_DN311_c2_g4_i1.p1  ORF type:complete len:555 (-),score=187.91 TRINITY_DN311_c2_g4_i1:108-1772(-)